MNSVGAIAVVALASPGPQSHVQVLDGLAIP
jgi:hypothetical protein